MNGENQNQAAQGSPRKYDDVTTTIASFGFTYNNLLSISLVRRIPYQDDHKERYFAFLTFVPGVGQGNQRSYDFKQRITQKIALKDMEMIAFTLEQTAIGNFNVLPYKGYTNSGSGSKCFFVQRNEKGDGIALGISQSKSITFVLNWAQCHAIGTCMRKLYDKGMTLEIDYQMNERNRTRSNQNPTGLEESYKDDTGFNYNTYEG